MAMVIQGQSIGIEHMLSTAGLKDIFFNILGSTCICYSTVV